MKIAILNGPNLNLLGSRETEIYGHTSFEVHFENLQKQYPGHQLQYFQTNIEGELVSAIQNYGFYNQAEAIVLNAGGYSHTSVAIADAVRASKVPVIVVHISNIFARETVRHTDLLSGYAKGMICGLGLEGYNLAVGHLLLNSKDSSAI